MWLGRNKYKTDKPLGIKWQIGEKAIIKILGVLFSNNVNATNISKNWTDRLDKIGNIITNWNKRNLSLVGKVCIIKTLIVSQLTHMMMVFKIPDKFLTQINTMIYKFLWRHSGKGSEKIKRTIFSKEYIDGGLDMIDIFW